MYFIAVKNDNVKSAIKSSIPIILNAISGSLIPAKCDPANIIVIIPATNRLITHTRFVLFDSIFFTPSVYISHFNTSHFDISYSIAVRYICQEPFPILLEKKMLPVLVNSISSPKAVIATSLPCLNVSIFSLIGTLGI